MNSHVILCKGYANILCMFQQNQFLTCFCFKESKSGSISVEQNQNSYLLSLGANPVFSYRYFKNWNTE